MIIEGTNLIEQAIAVRDMRCDACVAVNNRWSSLVVCLTCGHVACCNSSPGRHAREHARLTGHVAIGAVDRPQTWRWWRLFATPQLAP